MFCHIRSLFVGRCTVKKLKYFSLQFIVLVKYGLFLVAHLIVSNNQKLFEMVSECLNDSRSVYKLTMNNTLDNNVNK